jgi:DNA topoisomerase VI subunit B
MSTLERTVFEISRASEYFDTNELEKMTGRRVSRFDVVVLKELKDNALDACESAGVSPRINLTLAEEEEGRLRIVAGIPLPLSPPTWSGAS